MGRLFSALLLSVVLLSAALLLLAREAAEPAQPVFFSLLFPQLTEEEPEAGEAVLL